MENNTNTTNTKSRTILKLLIGFLAGICVASTVIALLFFGFGNFTLVNKDAYKVQSEFYDEYKDLAYVDMAVDNMFYLDKESDDQVDAACKAVVDSLGDKYSAYMNHDEYESFKTSSLGSYSGVGITFSANDDGDYVVISVTKGAPADKIGIEPGDILLKVDGKYYDDQDLFASKIRGDKGTTVKLTYSRDGKTNTVSLVRDKINQVSVEHKVLEDGTGYIAVSQFIDLTAEDFDKALKDLESKGCKKLILDLRDNGGGLVDESVDIADQFIESGIITYTEDKNGESEKFEAKPGATKMETVVLVNENSASASEILAGALKDNGYKLVGTKTFGKGIIQSTIELEDGSAIKLTIAQYFTPDGHTVHKKGIKPDYEVKNKGDKDAQLEKAESLLK
ncbi:MAG: S41 family peptidase [Eubacterium sp.]|nr:S41 family peptidase [Candidatus Colimonas fimequi]